MCEPEPSTDTSTNVVAYRGKYLPFIITPLGFHGSYLKNHTHVPHVLSFPSGLQLWNQAPTSAIIPLYAAYGPNGTRCAENGTAAPSGDPSPDDCFGACGSNTSQPLPFYFNYLADDPSQPNSFHCYCVGQVCTLTNITSGYRRRILEERPGHRRLQTNYRQPTGAYQINQYATTKQPTRVPSKRPSLLPSLAPTVDPSQLPSSIPSVAPSQLPTGIPSQAPSSQPSLIPSSTPTAMPSQPPSNTPSQAPSGQPSSIPTLSPSQGASQLPTQGPTTPTMVPSLSPPTPTQVPTKLPTAPTQVPTKLPTQPTQVPTKSPSQLPSIVPTNLPSQLPTAPTKLPSQSPSMAPSKIPSDVCVHLVLFIDHQDDASPYRSH